MPGAAAAEVEEEFLAENLPAGLTERWGITGGAVAIRRQADPKGRTKAAINGAAATLAQLSEIGGSWLISTARTSTRACSSPRPSGTCSTATASLKKRLRRFSRRGRKRRPWKSGLTPFPCPKTSGHTCWTFTASSLTR
ncbi:MAG: hypothetical protein Q7R35_07615 [Elusimicrobiota bacterium]|nr:hypothetical protein [Elusimicrobiota bacterium]